MSASGIRYRRDGVPDPMVDSLLVIIAHVNLVIENIVLGGPTRLCNRSNYSLNALFRPLRTIRDLMKSFVAHVDRFADRVRMFERLQPEMDRIYKDRTIYDDERYPRLLRYLKKTGDIESYYCDLFLGMSNDLGPVVEALETLAKFIRTIHAEGNDLAINAARLSALTDSSVTTSSDGDASPNFPYNGAQECIEAAYSSHGLSSSPIHGLMPTPAPRYTNSVVGSFPGSTPCWKISLANRFPVDNLSVTRSEIQVFGVVLKKIRAAKYAVMGARELCNIRGNLANDMKAVLKLWTDRYEQWADQTNGWEEDTWDEGFTEEKRVNPGLPEDEHLF